MNQFLSNKIIAGIVAVAMLVGVGVLISSGDTSSTTRNAALVAATPCPKAGQVTKVSKQGVVCATTNLGNVWYLTTKAKGKPVACNVAGKIRKKSNIVWVCGVAMGKKLWTATQPLPPAVVASTTVIEPGATQPTPALDSTQLATPSAPVVVADNRVLADLSVPDDKIVIQVIDDATTPTVAPTTPATTTTTTIPKTCATGGTCEKGDTGPGGGIVFYVATAPFTSTNSGCGTTCKYLELAAGQLRAAWGCYGTTTGATGTAIGTGKSNTDKILANSCTIAGIAADIANKYFTTSTAGAPGAAGQWFLPSKDELNELCKTYSNGRTDTTSWASDQNGCTGSFSPSGGFELDYYWSSSEGSKNNAWYLGFQMGAQYNDGKWDTNYVRAVRAF